MDRLFKRTATLHVARAAVGIYGSPVLEHVTSISGLRFTFQISRDLEKNPNSGTIALYNANESTRSEFQWKPCRIEIEAGYEDSESLLFRGDLRWAQSTREGPDWVTKIQAGDGDRALRHARLNKSYGPGTNKKTIIRDLAGAMGLSVPSDRDSAIAFAEKFANGVTVDGICAEQMDKLMRAHGYDWSIQDGTLQFYRENEVKPNTAIVISQKTGMIGVPEYGAPSKPGESPTLSVGMLLRPEIVPACKIRIESASLDGFFKVKKVAHKGDTHGADWMTSVEAVPI